MRKRIILIGVILSVLLPINVKALSGSINISCNDSNVIVGNSTNCSITGNSDSEVSALAMTLSSGGSVSISNIVTSSVWQGDGSDGDIQLYTDSNKTGNFSIATFTVTGNSVGSGTITVSGVMFTGADFNDVGVSGKNIVINVKEKETPKPNPETTPKPSNNDNNNNNGNNSNNSNNNQVNKSNDATLKSLSVSGVNFEFSSDKYDYEADVNNDVDKIEIEAIVNNDKAKVTIPEDLSLKIGKNRFTIIVEAEDGTKKEYNISINRLDRKLSNNAYLSKLTIEGYDIIFRKDKYIYNIGDIKNNKLNVKAEAEDKTSKIDIYGNNSIGKNGAIVVKVTAEDKTTSEYIIYVNNNSTNIKDILLICFLCLLIISIIINFILILGKRKKLKN